jgi:hypothetical protein
MPRQKRKKIARIQRTINKAVQLGGRAVQLTGGDTAFDGFANKTLYNLLGVIVAAQGPEKACALMAEAYEAVETYTRPEC